MQSVPDVRTIDASINNCKRLHACSGRNAPVMTGSEIAARQLPGQVVGLPDRRRHDRLRRILRSPPVVNCEPSETKRLAMSCVCPQRFTTPSRASPDIWLLPRLWAEG